MPVTIYFSIVPLLYRHIHIIQIKHFTQFNMQKYYTSAGFNASIIFIKNLPDNSLKYAAIGEVMYNSRYNSVVSQSCHLNCNQFSALILLFYKMISAVNFTEPWLVYLTCGVSYNLVKNNLSWAFISWKVNAEAFHFLFR